MDDFIFRGRDIAEFGAVAAFGASMKTGAKVKRSEYDLPGGGSVIVGGEAYAATQRTVTIMPADGVTADAAWARDILSWLMAGRGEFVLHSDPDVCRIAQFDSEATYGTSAWPEGALQLTMTLQPLAYARAPEAKSADTEGGEATVTVSAQSAMEMPLRVVVRATGGPVTGGEIACGSETVALAGLALESGQELVYDAGQRLGDLMQLSAAGAAAWAHVTRWARLAATPGQKVTVRLTGGDGHVTVSARGRFPA